MILMRDFEIGKREAPAFSQASYHSIHSDREDTWSLITDELLTAGADSSSIHSQREFIRQWIDDVCVVDESDEVTSTVEPKPEDGSNSQALRAPVVNPPMADVKTGSVVPLAFERWERLSSHWEGLTSYWIRHLERNEEECRGQPLLERLKKQVTDLSAAGANLFHAIIELQRLRASSERKFQRWFFETRAEHKRNQENTAKLEERLHSERQLREAATKLLLNS